MIPHSARSEMALLPITTLRLSLANILFLQKSQQEKRFLLGPRFSIVPAIPIHESFQCYHGLIDEENKVRHKRPHFLYFPPTFVAYNPLLYTMWLYFLIPGHFPTKPDEQDPFILLLCSPKSSFRASIADSLYQMSLLTTFHEDA